ncbi:MAG: response regulator [Treponema sp.]|jgi:signal transduction histidine kinase/CheY-like chemotaxis protein|nr:response regulator [Treponema sp.]
MKIIHFFKKIIPKRPLHIQVLFTALAFLAMALLSYVFMNTIVRGHMVRNIEAVLTFQRASIETSLREFRTPLELTSMEIRNLILRGEGAESIQAFFTNLSGQFSVSEKQRVSVDGLAGYFETLPSGPAFITSLENPPENINLADHPWYEAAISAGGDIVETVVYDDIFSEGFIFVYSRCIYDDEGRRLGVIGLRMIISAMGQEVIETALTQGGYGMLLSRDMIMLAHPHPDFIGRQLRDLDVTIASFEEEFRRGGEISERPVVTFRNEDAVAFFRRLSNGWYLGIVTPNGTYYKSVRLMMYILSTLAVTFATALIAVLISIDMARKKSDAESKHKSAFLANMSHEIRTPMNAIIGMVAIGKSAEDMDRVGYCFTKIEDASNHLLGVINDILDMSKIEANKLELSPVEFNFEKMLQRAVNVINFRVDEKQQRLMVHIDRTIPKTLIGDDQRLAQVITNLLSNAVKFTPEKGSINLYISLKEEDDDYCTIQTSVTDTGIGISREQQVKLFHSFQQAEAGTTRKFGGSGLGLTISKNIVEMMGGKIWIDSKEGEGATFTFTVQLRRGAENEQGLLDPGVNWSNIRIMAVDDDRDVLEYFREIAHGFNIFCDIAMSGEDALRLVEMNGHYHIYFVDWKMPNMNGVQLAAELKARESSKSVVIMISSTEWVEIESDAKKAGVDKFLAKPLFPSAIAEAINECLGVDKEKIKEAQTDIAGIFAGHHILLAEDVEINREIVMTLLEPTLLKIDCAENGEEAVRMFSQSPDKYDMIFMDVQMPKMDGYEATRSIRVIEEKLSSASKDNILRKIPIIAMTANVFKEDVEECLRAGMNSHLGKPLDFNDVITVLRVYLK